MLTKWWPQQKRSLLIKWTRWPIQWTPFSLLPQSLLSWAYEQSGHGVKNGGYPWAQQQTFTLQGSPGYVHWWMPSLSIAETMLSSQHDIILWDAQQPTKWQADYLTASIMEESAFCPCCNICVLGTDLSSLHAMLSPGDTVTSLSLKLKLSPDHFGFLMPLN